jgi:uncharacterized protein
MQIYIDRLNKILTDNNVSECHGLNHAIQVMNNAQNASNAQDYKLSEDEKECILLAALLHDADDRKFFPNNRNYENLRSILHDKNEEVIYQVMCMIDLVSSSKNGDSIPDFVKNKEWLLIPRYADRLEAIGVIGIERCYLYGKVKNPVADLYLDITERGYTESELWEIATIERYNSYTGNSVSMIDHYYDKLLRASIFPIQNPYFDKECEKRRKPIIKFLLFFANKRSITDEDTLEFIKSYKDD